MLNKGTRLSFLLDCLVYAWVSFQGYLCLVASKPNQRGKRCFSFCPFFTFSFGQGIPQEAHTQLAWYKHPGRCKPSSSFGAFRGLPRGSVAVVAAGAKAEEEVVVRHLVKRSPFSSWWLGSVVWWWRVSTLYKDQGVKLTLDLSSPCEASK